MKIVSKKSGKSANVISEAVNADGKKVYRVRFDGANNTVAVLADNCEVLAASNTYAEPYRKMINGKYIPPKPIYKFHSALVRSGQLIEAKTVLGLIRASFNYIHATGQNARIAIDCGLEQSQYLPGFFGWERHPAYVLCPQCGETEVDTADCVEYGNCHICRSAEAFYNTWTPHEKPAESPIASVCPTCANSMHVGWIERLNPDIPGAVRAGLRAKPVSCAECFERTRADPLIWQDGRAVIWLFEPVREQIYNTERS